MTSKKYTQLVIFRVKHLRIWMQPTQFQISRISVVFFIKYIFLKYLKWSLKKVMSISYSGILPIYWQKWWHHNNTIHRRSPFSQHPLFATLPYFRTPFFTNLCFASEPLFATLHLIRKIFDPKIGKNGQKWRKHGSRNAKIDVQGPFFTLLLKQIFRYLPLIDP